MGMVCACVAGIVYQRNQQSGGTGLRSGKTTCTPGSPGHSCWNRRESSGGEKNNEDKKRTSNGFGVLTIWAVGVKKTGERSISSWAAGVRGIEESTANRGGRRGTTPGC